VSDAGDALLAVCNMLVLREGGLWCGLMLFCHHHELRGPPWGSRAERVGAAQTVYNVTGNAP
jgi:hypothetical protein